MARCRITIMIDSEINKKIRNLQAQQIKKTNSSVSYSKVVEQLLAKSLKK